MCVCGEQDELAAGGDVEKVSKINRLEKVLEQHAVSGEVTGVVCTITINSMHCFVSLSSRALQGSCNKLQLKKNIVSGFWTIYFVSFFFFLI